MPPIIGWQPKIGRQKLNGDINRAAIYGAFVSQVAEYRPTNRTGLRLRLGSPKSGSGSLRCARSGSLPGGSSVRGTSGQGGEGGVNMKMLLVRTIGQRM